MSQITWRLLVGCTSELTLIEYKSKADGIAKALAYLQVSWFASPESSAGNTTSAAHDTRTDYRGIRVPHDRNLLGSLAQATLRHLSLSTGL